MAHIIPGFKVKDGSDRHKPSPQGNYRYSPSLKNRADSRKNELLDDAAVSELF